MMSSVMRKKFPPKNLKLKKKVSLKSMVLNMHQLFLNKMMKKLKSPKLKKDKNLTLKL